MKAALDHAGIPPRLDIQAMLNAAFAVDGPNLTAMVFEVAIGDRVAALDATPHPLTIPAQVRVVELTGQFLLMLLGDRMDLLHPRLLSGTPPAPG